MTKETFKKGLAQNTARPLSTALDILEEMRDNLKHPYKGVAKRRIYCYTQQQKPSEAGLVRKTIFGPVNKSQQKDLESLSPTVVPQTSHEPQQISQQDSGAKGDGNCRLGLRSP